MVGGCDSEIVRFESLLSHVIAILFYQNESLNEISINNAHFMHDIRACASSFAVPFSRGPFSSVHSRAGGVGESSSCGVAGRETRIIS